VNGDVFNQDYYTVAASNEAKRCLELTVHPVEFHNIQLNGKRNKNQTFRDKA
jgi:hypothetical protein